MSISNQCRTMALAIVLLASCLNQAAAGDKRDGARFTFKAFHPDSGVHYQKVTINISQRMTVAGMNMSQSQKQTIYFRYAPKQFDKVGNFVVRLQIIGAIMEIEIGKRNKYESFKGKPQNPAVKSLRALTTFDVDLTVNMQSRHVTHIKGLDAFLKRVKKANPKQYAIINGMVQENALKRMIEPTLHTFPSNGNYSLGYGWAHKSNFDLGPVGFFNSNTKYKLTSVHRKKAVVDVKTQSRFSKPKNQAKLPFTIRQVNFDKNEATGQAVVDLEKGFVENLSIKRRLRGQLKIEIGGTTTMVHMDQRETLHIATSSKNPLAK